MLFIFECDFIDSNCWNFIYFQNVSRLTSFFFIFLCRGNTESVNKFQKLVIYFMKTNNLVVFYFCTTCTIIKNTSFLKHGKNIYSKTDITSISIRTFKNRKFERKQQNILTGCKIQRVRERHIKKDVTMILCVCVLLTHIYDQNEMKWTNVNDTFATSFFSFFIFFFIFSSLHHLYWFVIFFLLAVLPRCLWGNKS